ncbi:MAG: phosphoribosylglycinamide formyltransferase [Ruminococcus sp.]|jgi:phosphoribosylglycinamide formyltransferase-1|nr:phosphoribosylglycinamide formyltransferase [Ruminococcus sp.]
MKRIAVLVSGGGTNLQALIDYKLKSGEIVLVVSSKEGAFALTRAENAGIKTLTLPRKNFPDSKSYSEELIQLFLEQDIDVIVLAGFMTVLDDSFCAVFKGRIVNVHPALIPSFCGVGYYGLKVHEEALKRGVKITGATVHIVTPECDGGPILAQKAVEVRDNDTPETLQRRVMEEAEWVILPEAVEKLCAKL